MDNEEEADPKFSGRAKLAIILVLGLGFVLFILQIRAILYPFLWAFFAAYLLSPVVNYLNLEGGLPRIWSVILIYASVGLLLYAGSRSLYPQIVNQGTVFLEDIPRLETSLITQLGPRPLGINITALVSQLLDGLGGVTNNSRSASHLLVNALETVIKLFLFLVSTFYLLMDAPRLRTAALNAIPPAFQGEWTALAVQINVTWKQYIRGEVLLFVIMAAVTTVGLTILAVPGALFLGLMSGALELLPLVGPITAGSLAVSVAYFNETNPYGWSQAAYAGAVALLYFILRQAEDYFVVPHVLGRAVRLHPLVVLFSVTAGGIMGGLFGLVIAVPIAASIKEILVYLYAKILDLPIEFQPIRTFGGGVIEIPIHGRQTPAPETPAPEGTGTT